MLVLFVSIFAAIATALFTYFYLLPQDKFSWWNIPAVFAGSWVVIFLLFVLFLVFIAALHSKKTKVIKPKAIYPFFIYHVAVFLRWLYNIRVVFENKEALPKDGKFLLVLNHQSMLDPIVTISCMKGYDVVFILKDLLMKVPFRAAISMPRVSAD